MFCSCNGILYSHKRREVLIHWMNLENIMIGERSQSQKHIHCIIHLNKIIRIGKSTDTESKSVVAQACRGQRERGVSANGLDAALREIKL